jgi:CheY-like chemotaxis protein
LPNVCELFSKEAAVRSVLIIDDNSDIRALLKLALEAEDYTVYQAENGSIAQKQLREGLRPHVILLDLLMPVMDGREFLRWKSQNAEFDELPVLVISALHAGENLQGAKGYLKKPLDLSEMFNVVGELCKAEPCEGR